MEKKIEKLLLVLKLSTRNCLQVFEAVEKILKNIKMHYWWILARTFKHIKNKFVGGKQKGLTFPIESRIKSKGFLYRLDKGYKGW